MVISLERGADLHVAQLMPLPLTVSCFSKIQIGFTFLVPAHPGSPGQRAIKQVCACSSIYEITVHCHKLGSLNSINGSLYACKCLQCRMTTSQCRRHPRNQL